MVVSGLIFIGAITVVLIFWLVFVTDGAYLGSKAVRFIYNRSARLWNLDDEASMGKLRREANVKLMRAIRTALRGLPAPNILDVATGTGRVPLLVASEPGFDGHVIGIDMSRNMIAKGRVLLQSKGVEDRAELVEGKAESLPWSDATFDLVTCIDCLDMLSAKAALAEMERVLRPGGRIVLTKSTDRFGRLKPGKALSRKALAKSLDRLGFIDVEFEPDYGATDEIVLAVKAGVRAPGVEVKDPVMQD